jgi:hypothetical protein
MTYKLEYMVWHVTHGDVMIPDQVVERMALWDQVGMPVPAITEWGKVVEIYLMETDA